MHEKWTTERHSHVIMILAYAKKFCRLYITKYIYMYIHIKKRCMLWNISEHDGLKLYPHNSFKVLHVGFQCSHLPTSSNWLVALTSGPLMNSLSYNTSYVKDIGIVSLWKHPVPPKQQTELWDPYMCRQRWCLISVLGGKFSIVGWRRPISRRGWKTQ